MGQYHRSLVLDERIEISRLDKDGISLRMIAAALSRSASSIRREIKRTSRKTKADRPPRESASRAGPAYGLK